MQLAARSQKQSPPTLILPWTGTSTPRRTSLTTIMIINTIAIMVIITMTTNTQITTAGLCQGHIPQAFSAVSYLDHHPSSLFCCIIPRPSSLEPSLLYHTTTIIPQAFSVVLYYTVTTIPLASLVYYTRGLIERKLHSKMEYMELNGERYLKFKCRKNNRKHTGGDTFTWLHNQVGKKNREKIKQNQNLIRTKECVEGGSKVVDIVAGDAVIQNNGSIVPKQVKQPHAALLARQSAASSG